MFRLLVMEVAQERYICYGYVMASFYSLLKTEVLADTVSPVHPLVAPVAKTNQLQRIEKYLYCIRNFIRHTSFCKAFNLDLRKTANTTGFVPLMTKIQILFT